MGRRRAARGSGVVNPVPVAELAGALRRFKPYPAYKDSGIEWLGQIPVHWGLRRLKTIASVHLSNVDKKSVEGEIAVHAAVDVGEIWSVLPALKAAGASSILVVPVERLVA